MTKQWPLIFLPVVLAACTPSQSREVVTTDAGASGYPARLPLAQLSANAQAAPIQPEGATWRAEPRAVHFAVPGQTDLFALGCRRAADGTALLEITRRTRADAGAKALFALIGNGHVSRLPLDAVRAGEAGEWQAAFPAADERLDVLRGGNRIEATLPGGGTLMLPASREPGRLLDACRSGASANS